MSIFLKICPAFCGPKYVMVAAQPNLFWPFFGLNLSNLPTFLFLKYTKFGEISPKPRLFCQKITQKLKKTAFLCSPPAVSRLPSVVHPQICYSNQGHSPKSAIISPKYVINVPKYVGFIPKKVIHSPKFVLFSPKYVIYKLVTYWISMSCVVWKELKDLKRLKRTTTAKFFLVAFFQKSIWQNSFQADIFKNGTFGHRNLGFGYNRFGAIGRPKNRNYNRIAVLTDFGKWIRFFTQKARSKR